MTNKTITSYKGFDKDFKCRGFQYEIGKEYTTDKAECCDSGFHACPMPLSVFDYYEPATSKYALVEQSGDFDQEDDKIASTKIKIKAELSLFDLVKAQVEWVKSQIKPDDKQSNTGNRSAATVKGKNSVALAYGTEARAKAKENGCIVICDWRKDDNNDWYIKDIYSDKVGGKNHSIPLIPQQEDVFNAIKKESEYVFTYRGKKIKSIKTAWENIFYKRGGKETNYTFTNELRDPTLPYKNFHTLRHTAGTWILKNCGNLKITKEILGHADMKTTLKYAHVLDDEKRNALLTTFNFK